ncbi:MAG: hypothetical protein CMI53_04465 [Parcubacteria group bacterium]|nr:hypothetical protein [Parcubacteria group bacterium]
MLDPVKQTILYDQNAIYYGYPIAKLMEKAGKGIAQVLLKKYGTNNKIGFFCGPGNNGGDGFAAARYLTGKADTAVYLIPSAIKIKTSESRKNWKLYKGEKFDNVIAKDIPNDFDIVVECLFGTGLKGEVREPYKSVIKKLNKLKGKKVTIDLPVPGFKTNFSISMMFPKMTGATVVDIGFPKSIAEKIGVGEVKVLNQPGDSSHKGDNGKILIIGGSKYFHGAPVYASKTASKIVDLVYFSSVPENNEVIKKMKTKTNAFITVPRAEVFKAAKKVDVILIGPGLGVDQQAKQLTNDMLKKFKNKKFVLDADALKVVDKKLLNKNCIVTPHKQEFKKLFGLTASRQAAGKMAKKYNCIVVLKGVTDFVADHNQTKLNTTGNAGMTKGGTGDVLAGLIGGLACTNGLFLAASAGVFINGLAGDRLKKKVYYNYNATDLIKEIPKTIKWCLDF